MKFKEAVGKVIGCLQRGDYQHEPRKDINTKNKLHTQEKSPAEVIEIVKCCPGTYHKTSPHDADRSVLVHELTAQGRYKGWYIKFYFVADGTTFISVHQ